MKRVVKNFLIASGILGAIGAALVLVSVFMGAHFSDLWNGNLPVTQFFWNGHLVSSENQFNSTYRQDNTYTVSAEGIDTLKIDWVNGEVNVQAGETDQIIFSESGADLTEKTALQYVVKDHALHIQYSKDGITTLGWGEELQKKLTLTVPQSLAEKLAELRIEVVSANVQFDGAAFRMDQLDIETVSGNLNAVIDSAGTAELGTVSGNLSVSGAINEVDAESTSGNISVSGAINRFEAESVSGDVLLDGRNGAPNQLDVDTTSGNVVLYLPKDADLTLNYETVSGDFDSAFAMSMHNGNYVINGGRSEWSVETVSGDLTVR